MLTIIWLAVTTFAWWSFGFAVIGDIVALFTIGSINDQLTDTKKPIEIDTPRYRSLKFTQMMAFQTGIIISVAAAILMSIPSPTYNIRTVVQNVPVVKIVEKIVEKPVGIQTVIKHDTYLELYEKCVAPLTGDAGDPKTGTVALCRAMAVEGSKDR